MLNFRPYLEWKNTVDEYADEHTIGLFIGTWCLIGFRHQPPHRSERCQSTGEGEMYGFILFNCSIGIWRDPNPELPPSGWGDWRD